MNPFTGGGKREIKGVGVAAVSARLETPPARLCASRLLYGEAFIKKLLDIPVAKPVFLFSEGQDHWKAFFRAGAFQGQGEFACTVHKVPAAKLCYVPPAVKEIAILWSGTPLLVSAALGNVVGGWNGFKG
jgi:hypothetical protein